MTDAGIMYLATGRAAFWPACLLSIRSVRRARCAAPIVVATDLPDELWPDRAELGYTLMRLGPLPSGPPPSAFEAWSNKMRLYRHSPFARTIYLDSDTIVRAPPDALWEAATASGLALTFDRDPTIGQLRRAHPDWGDPRDWDETIRVCGPDALHYNVGVFAWAKRAETERFFDLWLSEWNKYRSTDQCPLIRALYVAGVEPAVLPEEYNAQVPATAAFDRAVIRHFNGCPKPMLLDMMLRSMLGVGRPATNCRQGPAGKI